MTPHSCALCFGASWNPPGTRSSKLRTATQGVAVFKSAKPELVISDVVMPKKDGIETVRELRDVDAEVKVIAISGGGRTCPQDCLKAAEKQGANATMAKPFRRETFLGLVEQVLAEAA